MDADGTAVGSVSGGCVEGAVYELCRQALRDGRPVPRRFGHSDEDAFAEGLTCGGVVDVLVMRYGPAIPSGRCSPPPCPPPPAGSRRRWRAS